jgi:hypothetical protein
MKSVIVSSESGLQEKGRGGGQHDHSTSLAVVNNFRSLLVRRRKNDPFISTGALTYVLMLLMTPDITPSFPLE